MKSTKKTAYFDRNKTIFSLALSDWSYRRLAAKYGISQARIGQIINSFSFMRELPCLTCGKSMRMDREHICIEKGMAREPVAGHKKKNIGVHGKGWQAQRLFEMECEKHDISFVPKYRTENFDYLINGLRVEIKFVTMDNGQGVALIKKNNFDLLVCYIQQKKPVWIFVPKALTAAYPGGGFCITNEKILLLKDRWELLKML